MNLTLISVLKMLLPLIEPAILQEWETQAMPALQGMAGKLEAGKGLEEAQALVEFLDKLAKIELARQV